MLKSAPVTKIRGIGPKSAEVFAKAGIETVSDLIHYYPRAYDRFEDPVDVSVLGPADARRTVAVEGWIETPLSTRFLKAMKITTGKIRTRGGVMEAVWYNMPFMRSQIRPGTNYIFRGQVRVKGRRVDLLQPKAYDLADYIMLQKNLQPVYPLTAGLTESALRRALKNAFYGDDPVQLSDEEDPVPASVRGRYGLISETEALRSIHFPEDEETMKRARRSLAFREFFFFILMLRVSREKRMKEMHSYELPPSGATDQVLASLPYSLTGAQSRVWKQISSDLARKEVMARLIQGDVGSGKTIIAFLAMVQTAAAGFQAAIMVPTEVLARQHYESFTKMCGRAGLDLKAVLLTGALRAAQKRQALEMIETGDADVIIGTHALIQQKVNYRKLGLIVTDEQHRFGVNQRETLAGKGDEVPHTIVMSATPIPRTLAVILYGDLDISIIDEKPAERLPVKNAVVDASWRPKAYVFIASQAKAGHQAYVICPMVEESEEIDAENVTDYADSLRAELCRYIPDISVQTLHGRMKNDEKNAIMEQFAAGQIDVLVSTTVVEVGVNVPNATVMMVENAERFGLAQLHQLRGRVGRGKDQSYCIFMHTKNSDKITERLSILENTNDGFKIAQKDLELRGPGELFGVRQSGELSFEIADLYGDADLMQEASAAAGEILNDDPDLTGEKYAPIREEIRRKMRSPGGQRMHMTL